MCVTCVHLIGKRVGIACCKSDVGLAGVCKWFDIIILSPLFVARKQTGALTRLSASVYGNIYTVKCIW